MHSLFIKELKSQCLYAQYKNFKSYLGFLKDHSQNFTSLFLSTDELIRKEIQSKLKPQKLAALAEQRTL